MKQFFAVIMFFLVFVSMVFAQTTSQPASPWGELFSEIFMNYVAPVLGSVILGIFAILLGKLLKRFNIKLEHDTEQTIYRYAERLILAAEEQASAALQTQGKKIEGGEKLASVVNGLVKKFPKISEDQAKEIALEMVTKIPGIGITNLPRQG